MLERETPESTLALFLDVVVSGSDPGCSSKTCKSFGVMIVGLCTHGVDEFPEFGSSFWAAGTWIHVADEVQDSATGLWCPRFFGKGLWTSDFVWVDMLAVLLGTDLL